MEQSVAQVEDLQRQLSEIKQQVEILAADCREIAGVLSLGVNRIRQGFQLDFVPNKGAVA